MHTGFEWNKYNQTHYDMDNPPPKIVQGYKFNIFYPDLIDKNSTPEYHLVGVQTSLCINLCWANLILSLLNLIPWMLQTACPDNADFAILRFHAGPPYEDIAFKVVNREWEYSYKKGFRCQFQNNIFQLWFHFKRYRYRRWYQLLRRYTRDIDFRARVAVLSYCCSLTLLQYIMMMCT